MALNTSSLFSGSSPKLYVSGRMRLLLYSMREETTCYRKQGWNWKQDDLESIKPKRPGVSKTRIDQGQPPKKSGKQVKEQTGVQNHSALKSENVNIFLGMLFTEIWCLGLALVQN